MSEKYDRRTDEGFRRLIAFTDAVVAIALTLLVLPLVDIIHDVAQDPTVGQVFDEHSDEITSFLISFVVIWVLWRNHHGTFEYFKNYDRVIFNLHLPWLLTIVVLPFVTALISGNTIKGASVFYMAVLWLSIASVMVMSMWGRRHRELLHTGDDVDAWLARLPDFGTLILLTVAIVITLVVPGSGLYSLLLLFAVGPVNAVIERWVGRGKPA
ncbi:TMEM175 family protein [Gordonia polyisoprenivorans]|uniref:TMEM175 family protein n=1 Tax=Gordonia polyisoprenivorans TaxID=84595 RepID=UPI0030CC8646